MTTAQINEWYGQPKKCTKCLRVLYNRDFECVKARGKVTQRSRCRQCMAAYYNSAEYVAGKKHRYQEKTAVRPGETFVIKKAGEQWRVFGVIEGQRTRPLNLCKTEQEAEAAVKRRRVEQIKRAHKKLIQSADSAGH